MGDAFWPRTSRRPRPLFPWALSCCFPMVSPHRRRVAAKQVLLIYKARRIRTFMSLPPMGAPVIAQVDAPAQKPALQDHFPTEEAWVPFWKKLRTIGLSTAWKVLRNRSDAEDAVQNAVEALLKFIASGHQVNVQKDSFEESVTALFITIVRWRALDILPKGAPIQPPVESPEPVSRDPNPEEQMLLKSLPGNVFALVAQLSPLRKKLFLLIWLHIDEDPEEHWRIWAVENGLDPSDKKARNAYDKLKENLRNSLRALGIYKLLKGKE